MIQAQTAASIDLHTIYEILSGLVMMFWLIIGLLIKSSLGDIKLRQQQDRSELLLAQADAKELLTARHTLIENKLDVHIAKTEEKFTSMGRTLSRIDGKIDNLSNRPICPEA